MKKLQIIVIIFLISFSICTFASMQAKACTTYTYTASVSPTSTYAGLTGVSYTVTFTDTGSSDMSSGTITIPTGYTTVSLTSVKASGGQFWSGSVSSPTISFTASSSSNRITAGQTVTVVFSATNPSSAGSYTWKTTGYSSTWGSGTAFTIGGSQPTVTVNQLTITVTQTANGLISPGTSTVNYGATPSFTITPNTDYHIASITADASVIVTSPSGQTYQFNPVSTDGSLTATFAINTYTITVTSAYGNPTASASVNAGNSFTASVNSPESAGVGQQWICTGYSIDGGSVVSGTSYTFTDIQSSHAITFNWQEQYYLTTSTNFGSVVPVSGWYDAGSTVTLSATAPSTGSGEQYVWNGWTGVGTGSYTGTDNPATGSEVTMNGPVTEAASWTDQYQVTFSSSGLNADASGNLVSYSVNGGALSTIGVSGGSIWVDSGTSVTYSFVNPVTSTNAGEQYRLDSVTDPASVSTTAVSGDSTVTGNYVTQYQVSFTQTGLTSDAGSNTVLTLGTSNYAYNDLPNSVWVDSGTTFSWSSPVAGVTGEQFTYATDSGLTSPITAPGTDTATYNTQYLVTFAASPSGSGSTSPTNTNVWENAGSLPITATPNTGYTFASWSSNTESITFDNANSASATATIGGTGTITATFAINNYDVTVNVGADGSSNLASQTVNWNTQLNFVLTPDAGYSVSNVAVNGTSIGTVTSISLTITGDTTVSVNFAINTYSLTVNVGTDGSSNIASQTVNWGSTENFAFTPDTGYSIANVIVNGSIDEGTITSLSLTITGPTTVSVNFAINTYTITTTLTPIATPTPPTPTPTLTATPTPILAPTATSSPTPSPTPLYVVLLAVIIVATIIISTFSLIAFKRSRRKPSRALTNPEKSI